MYGLYKTELKNLNSSRASKSKISDATKIRIKKFQINNLLSRNDLNKKIINNSLNRKLLSENYLDFMIQEKLTYADVEKIIEHYSKKIDDYKKKHEENKNLILKKKEELNNLNMKIYKDLVNHMQFKGTKIEDEKPDEEKEKIIKEIKMNEHKLEIFKDLLNQTYKTNLNLSNKYFLQNNYSKVYEEQYERYNNVYTNSINKIQAQEEKLNLLNRYFNKYKNINDSLISENVDKLNRLEYEIVLIKNNVVDFEENFAKIQEKNKRLQKMLESAKDGYNIRNYDYNIILKNYLKEYSKMFEIYEIFKVDDIQHILKQFILIKQKYNVLSSKFNKSTNKLFKLRIELTKLETNLEKIKAQTKERKQKAKIDSEKSYRDVMDIINLQKSEFNISNIDLVNEYINRENLISFCLNHLLELNKKIIFSLNNSINKSPLLAKKKFEVNKKSKLIENVNIKSLGKMTKKNLIILIINLIKKTSTKIYEITQNVIYNIYSKILEKEEEQLNEEETIEEPKFDIISTNSEIVKNIYSSQLKQIREKLRVKKQIYSRNKDNILLNQNDNNKILDNIHPLNKNLRSSFSSDNIFNPKESQIFIKKYKIISHKDLFEEYNDFKRKDPVLCNSDFSGINKKLFIDEYSNELVAENDLEKMRNEKMQKIKEASKKINKKLEEYELQKFLKKKRDNKIIISLKKKMKKTKIDEQGEEELKEYEIELSILKNELKESKIPKKFGIKLADPENNLISNRYEEIRMLELNYIKNYSDYRVEQNIFNEYFYNVRKRFNEVNKRQSIHELNSNSLSTRNLINNKKIRKNFSIVLPKIDYK